MVTETRDHRKAKEISLKQDRDAEGGRNDETHEIKAGTETSIKTGIIKHSNFQDNKRQTQTPRSTNPNPRWKLLNLKDYFEAQIEQVESTHDVSYNNGKHVDTGRKQATAQM